MRLTGGDYRETTRLANEAGQNGWELVAVVPNLQPQPNLPDLQPVLWFKRKTT